MERSKCATSRAPIQRPGIMSENTRQSDPRNRPAARAGYQPQDRIEVQPSMPFNPYTGRHRALYPQAAPVTPSWGKRKGRWREYGILVGLWLLVMLVAVVIGFRILDLSAGAVRRDDPGSASASPAGRVSLAGLAPSRLIEVDDPFDDPPPGPPLVSEASPANIPTSTATATASTAASGSLRASIDMPAVRAQPAAAVDAAAPVVVPIPAVRRPTAPAGMRAVASARMPVACPPALLAMQLCGEPGN